MKALASDALDDITRLDEQFPASMTGDAHVAGGFRVASGRGLD